MINTFLFQRNTDISGNSYFVISANSRLSFRTALELVRFVPEFVAVRDRKIATPAFVIANMSLFIIKKMFEKKLFLNSRIP